jgi:hypothetical protein
MKVEGGCYCKGVRYEATGEPVMKVQCHCRECQYISGGAPVVILGMPAAGFRWTRGEPRAFTRSDLESPVTREFCPECGTHLTTRAPGMPDAVMVKVGTLDDPSVFGLPQVAIYAAEKQAFHTIPDGVPVFEGMPG